jgi:hypothetical protein
MHRNPLDCVFERLRYLTYLPFLRIDLHCYYDHMLSWPVRSVRQVA